MQDGQRGAVNPSRVAVGRHPIAHFPAINVEADLRDLAGEIETGYLGPFDTLEMADAFDCGPVSKVRGHGPYTDKHVFGVGTRNIPFGNFKVGFSPLGDLPDFHGIVPPSKPKWMRKAKQIGGLFIDALNNRAALYPVSPLLHDYCQII